MKTKAARLLTRVAVHLDKLGVGSDTVAVLPLRYDYRASDAGKVNFYFLLDGRDVDVWVHSMAFASVTAVKGEPSLHLKIPAVKRSDVLCVNLTEPAALLNGVKLTTDYVQQRGARKFVSEVTLSSGGVRRRRLCSHYLPFDNKPVGSDYYFGDDYVNYPQQTAAADGVALVKRYGVSGRLLDIGCALGIYTKAFLDIGFDAHGMDVSEFAISEAAKRVGAERVRCASLEADDIPFAGEFDVLWLSDVLEHFAAPEAALAKATQHAASGAWLFLHTSNADSLTHRLFGKDWEGYSDYSHYGADAVTCASLRAWLDKLGWEIVEWECRNIWIEGIDPVMIRLKEVFHKSPELQVLLDEADLGDAIRLVARKR